MAYVDNQKEYRTRDGRKVRIYAMDAGGKFFVHGSILIEGSWHFCCWCSNGFANPDYSLGTNDYDLFEVPSNIKKDKIEFVVSTYPAIMHPDCKRFVGKRCKITIEAIARE